MKQHKKQHLSVVARRLDRLFLTYQSQCGHIHENKDTARACQMRLLKRKGTSVWNDPDYAVVIWNHRKSCGLRNSAVIHPDHTLPINCDADAEQLKSMTRDERQRWDSGLRQQVEAERVQELGVAEDEDDEPGLIGMGTVYGKPLTHKATHPADSLESLSESAKKQVLELERLFRLE